MPGQIVEKALEELQVNIILLGLGMNIVNSLLIFVTLFLITTILSLSFYVALVPALLFLIISAFFSYKKNRYLIVEDKYLDLKEKLRTVADNVNRSNPIIDSLKEDVVKSMNKVKSNEFIEYNSAYLKIIYIALVGVIIILVSFSNVNFTFDLKIPIVSSLFVREEGNETANNNLSFKAGNLSDILGNKSVAKFGNRELNLVINPLDSEADVNSIKQVSKEDFTPPNFPKEIYTSYDVAYNERIARQNQKVVKDYFEQIAR